MLALHDDTEVYSTLREGGYFTLPNGVTPSPALPGWQGDDGLKLSEIADSDPIPEGKRSTGAVVQLVGGVPKWVHSLEDAPAPVPVDTPPQQIATALKVVVTDGDVSSLGGSFRVAAMMLMDTGTFLAIFTQGLGNEPFIVPTNGISITISEWGGEYAVLEVRDHAGGSLITPASFGFSLYEF